MISIHKFIKFMAIALTSGLLLIACTNPFSNESENEASSVHENKLTRLERLAQAGDSDAQYDLAYMYENGLGVGQDESRALELYQSAADQGHPEAKNSLNALKSQ